MKKIFFFPFVFIFMLLFSLNVFAASDIPSYTFVSSDNLHISSFHVDQYGSVSSSIVLNSSSPSGLDYLVFYNSNQRRVYFISSSFNSYGFSLYFSSDNLSKYERVDFLNNFSYNGNSNCSVYTYTVSLNTSSYPLDLPFANSLPQSDFVPYNGMTLNFAPPAPPEPEYDSSFHLVNVSPRYQKLFGIWERKNFAIGGQWDTLMSNGTTPDKVLLTYKLLYTEHTEFVDVEELHTNEFDVNLQDIYTVYDVNPNDPLNGCYAILTPYLNGNWGQSSALCIFGYSGFSSGGGGGHSFGLNPTLPDGSTNPNYVPNVTEPPSNPFGSPTMKGVPIISTPIGTPVTPTFNYNPVTKEPQEPINDSRPTYYYIINQPQTPVSPTTINNFYSPDGGGEVQPESDPENPNPLPPEDSGNWWEKFQNYIQAVPNLFQLIISTLERSDTLFGFIPSFVIPYMIGLLLIGPVIWIIKFIRG